MGWRWNNTPDEETLTALKGLAYLKKELVRVQDQVIDLEGKLLEAKEDNLPEVMQKEILIKENETEVLEPKTNEFESQQFALLKNAAFEGFNSTETRRPNNGAEVNSQLSPKYQEVLELAAGGECIPDIAQRLFLSQDAVAMVLRMQPDGGNDN
ncbi:DNA-binding response regulator [Desulfosporosinus orientis]|uniref:DNA-binding response regulator n=1 Tax=Desulfosporosinus orientis TaxID=1563 RepID=UPI001FA7FA65|nr:DNA-binding response regulator [Desulfosporosinus orientis]